MSPIILTAMVAAAIGLWLFLGRRGKQAVRRVVLEKERGGVPQLTAALPSSTEMADKKHTVKMAVLRFVCIFPYVQ